MPADACFEIFASDLVYLHSSQSDFKKFEEPVAQGAAQILRMFRRLTEQNRFQRNHRKWVDLSSQRSETKKKRKKLSARLGGETVKAFCRGSLGDREPTGGAEEKEICDTKIGGFVESDAWSDLLNGTSITDTWHSVSPARG